MQFVKASSAKGCSTPPCRARSSPAPPSASHVTALDMGGCSITAVRADDEMLRLWDDAEDASDRVDCSAAGAWADAFISAADEQSAALNELDRQSGDGDFGAFSSAFMDTGGTSGPLDKTMVDAMVPAARALAGAGDLREGLLAAARAAREGAASTEAIAARRGRASYVGDVARGVLDPGAVTVALFFEGAPIGDER